MTSNVETQAPELYIEASARSFVTSLPLSALTVDPQLQRAYVKDARVQTMANEFNPDGLGVLEVSQRLSGTNHVLDGYHRMLMLRELRKRGEIGSDYMVWCKVFVGLTPAEEAALFVLLNNKEKVGPLDLFRIKLAAKDAIVLAMMDIITANNWLLKGSLPPEDFTGKVSEHSFSAVGALEVAYSRNPIAAEKSVKTLTMAWKHSPASVHGELVRGLGMFYNYYGDQADLLHAVKTLGRYPDAPSFRNLAKATRGARRGTAENTIARFFVEEYNVGKKTLALPPWPHNGKRSKKDAAAPVSA
jgi:hypothetical protein